jgi:hypothetical protein
VLIQFNRWSNNLKQVAKPTSKNWNEVDERVAIDYRVRGHSQGIEDSELNHKKEE